MPADETPPFSVEPFSVQVDPAVIDDLCARAPCRWRGRQHIRRIRFE